MKILIVAFISVFFLIEVLPAQATVINRDEANDYFSSCMSKKSADVKEETMTTLCACTSAKMVESMTSEELQTMAGTDATAQDARRKMLLEVYAPCSESIAVDLINTGCVNNGDLYEMDQNFNVQQVCGCSARSAAAWYQGKGKTLMTDILKTNPAMTDPAPALLAHPLLKNQILSNLVACTATSPEVK